MIVDFSRKGNKLNPIDIMGEEVEVVEEYFGVHLDNNDDWRQREKDGLTVHM